MTEEHILFLKRIKRRKIVILFLQIFITILFLGLWQILSDKNIINSFIYSSPKRVVSTFVKLIRENILFKNVLVTFLEVMISFLLGSFLGIIIASIFWRFRFIYQIFEPFLTILNSLPKVSLGPILIIIFGAGYKSIVVMALLISLIITIINIYNAFISTDQNKVILMKSFKASQRQIYFNLILPSNYMNIVNTLKVNISLTFIGVIMGEFLVSKAGIGYLILYGSQVFNLNLVISGIILLGFLSFILYLLISKLEKVR